MPSLRKTGIRFPFLPGPLQGNTDPLRQALVISALVPALLLGGNAQPIGRPAPPEDVSRPARPAIVLTIAAPLPSATAWMPRPLPSEALVRSAGIQTPAVPLPGSSLWAPAPAREPNALWAARPLLVVQPPWVPVPCAVTLSIGIPHDGDRLPWGIGVHRAVAPPPGAAVWAPSPAREPNSDPRRSIIIAAPWTPIPLAQAQAIGMPRSTSGDRLLSWTAIRAPSLPPSVVALTLLAPRDEVAAQPDRLAPIRVVTSAMAQPTAVPVFIRRVVAPPTDRLAPMGIIRTAQSYPGAASVLLPAPRDEAVVVTQDRLAPTQVIRQAGALPGATALSIGSVFPSSDRLLSGIQVAAQPAPIIGATALSAIGIPRSEDGLPARAYVVITASPPTQAITAALRALRDVVLQPDRVTGMVIIRAVAHSPGAITILLRAPFITELYGSLRIAWGALYPSIEAVGGHPGVITAAIGPETSAVAQQPGVGVIVVQPSLSIKEA